MYELDLEAILAQPDAEDEDLVSVEVPEWPKREDGRVVLDENGKEIPGVVFVKVMSGKEREQFDRSNMKKERSGRWVPREDGMMAFRLLIRTVVDRNRKPLFDMRHRDAITGKTSAALRRIERKAMEVNGLLDDQREEFEEDFDEADGEHSSSA
jgi:hypothetical protein